MKINKQISSSDVLLFCIQQIDPVSTRSGSLLERKEIAACHLVACGPFSGEAVTANWHTLFQSGYLISNSTQLLEYFFGILFSKQLIIIIIIIVYLVAVIILNKKYSYTIRLCVVNFNIYYIQHIYMHIYNMYVAVLQHR